MSARRRVEGFRDFSLAIGMIQTLLDGGKQLFLMILHALEIGNIGRKGLCLVSSIVQNEERGFWMIGKGSLNTKERLERVSVHTQMPLNRHGAALDKSSWQDALQIGFDWVTMDENDDCSQASTKSDFHLCFC